ncbi:MAG TPA: hypothetical protein VHH36_00640 [Candidatus Thermoplasmatota archaeon]|nr:hypothetical protein [Candidatus Thermoplasmatota archaeon]
MAAERRRQLLVWGVVALGFVSAGWVVAQDWLLGLPGDEPVHAARAPTHDDRPAGLSLPATPANVTPREAPPW